MTPLDYAFIAQSVAMVVLTGIVLFIATVCFRGLASVERRLTRIESLDSPSNDDASK